MVLVHAFQLNYYMVHRLLLQIIPLILCTEVTLMRKFTSLGIEHHCFCYREDVDHPQIFDTMPTMWILQEMTMILSEL